MAPLVHSTAALLERKRIDELRERSEALKAERLARRLFLRRLPRKRFALR